MVENLKFYVDAPTAVQYSKFLENLREYLTHHIIDKYNLKILGSESDVQENRYCMVDIYYNNKPLTLALNVVNLNLVAFQFETKSYFFTNTVDFKDQIFEGTEQVVMNFKNTYESLGSRAAVKLGKSELQNAVSILATYNQHDASTIKTSLINVIGMVSEAARLRVIEDVVTSNFDKDVNTTILMISYEDNWGDLSDNIQHADDQGWFPSPVYLEDENGITDKMTTVGEVKAKMGILKNYINAHGE